MKNAKLRMKNDKKERFLFRAYPNNGCTCHVEPFDDAQDKLRETSLFSGQCEILRSAQNDNTVGLWLFG